MPGIKAAASGGDQRDVFLLHGLRIQLNPIGMELAHHRQNTLVIPLAVAADLVVVQSRCLERLTPGAEVALFRGGGGKLRIDIQADIAPGQINFLCVQLFDSRHNPVAGPGLVAANAVIVKSGIVDGGFPRTKVPGGCTKK